MLQKGLTTYPFSVLLVAACATINSRTVRSVAHPLQDGGLASICTSYKEDSELDLCGNGVIVSHVCWEARDADRFDPSIVTDVTVTPAFLVEVFYYSFTAPRR